MFLATGGIKQRIELVKGPCHYEGFGYYFACPVVSNEVYCGNRVTKLFLPSGSSAFGRRECNGLTYSYARKAKNMIRFSGILNRFHLLRLCGL